MKLSSFGFTIPKDAVAQYPSKNRDESKMMVVDRKTGKIEHKKFRDILKYFGDGDSLILNDTKVFPARLYGTKEKTGAKIEVFLLRELNQSQFLWDVLVDPARKIRVGNKLYFGQNDDLIIPFLIVSAQSANIDNHPCRIDVQKGVTASVSIHIDLLRISDACGGHSYHINGCKSAVR